MAEKLKKRVKEKVQKIEVIPLHELNKMAYKSSLARKKKAEKE